MTLLTSPNFAVGADGREHRSATPAGLIQPQVGNPSTLPLIDLPDDRPGRQRPAGRDERLQGSERTGDPVALPARGSRSARSRAEPADQRADQPARCTVTPFVDLPHLSVVQILTTPHAAGSADAAAMNADSAIQLPLRIAFVAFFAVVIQETRDLPDLDLRRDAPTSRRWS